MPRSVAPAQSMTRQEIVDRARAIAPKFAARADSANDMFGAGAERRLDAAMAAAAEPQAALSDRTAWLKLAEGWLLVRHISSLAAFNGTGQDARPASLWREENGATGPA
jgi:uncharacterized protein YgiB involved in biofilm formation